MSATLSPPWWELVSPATVERWAELVRDTRALQRQYRATLCPMLRRELADIELHLDSWTDQICGAIVAARVLHQEGGAA